MIEEGPSLPSHPYIPCAQPPETPPTNATTKRHQSVVKVNLGSDGRLERGEAAVGDRATRRALQVERGHADLRGGDRPDGFEGEHEHLRVGGRSGCLIRNADENRAVGVDAVSEAAGLFHPAIPARPNRPPSQPT